MTELDIFIEARTQRIDELSRKTLGSYASIERLTEARRGRAPKNPSADRAMDEREHPIMQLRRASNLGGTKAIKFADGSSHEVSANHAQNVIDQHDALNKPSDKTAFADMVGSSHAAFKKACGLNEETKEVNEISKETLGRYIRSASSDRYLKGREDASLPLVRKTVGAPQKPEEDTDRRRKIENRRDGIGKAIHKLVAKVNEDERLPRAPRKQTPKLTSAQIAEADKARLARAVAILQEMAFGDK
jgi:hypothetical protein